MKMREIYISCLLKDNMILAYRISGNLKKEPEDYYKDFIYAGVVPNFKEYEVKWMSISIPEDTDTNFNNYIFEEVARRFYMQWNIHPDHFGSPAY